MFRDVRSVLILACGTSFHAGLVARYWIEQVAGLSCTVEIASEYRYRVPMPDPGHLQPAGIVAWAQRFAHKKHALFLGRGYHYPLALEGR